MADGVNDIVWENWDLKTMMSKNITVPIYQRPYSWEDDQVNEFLKDLDYFSISGYNSYLFGQTILMSIGDDKYELIDGQQRLTTCIIFLSAIRDIATELMLPNLDSFKSDIKTYIGGKSFGIESYHLTLGKVNKQYFLENIQRFCDPENLRDGTQHVIPEPPGKDNQSNMKILKTYQLVYEHLKNKIDNRDPEIQSKILEKYLKILTDKFKLSVVISYDLGQAYIIFETLNSRGLDLDATDLLKNYFFMICKGDQDVIDNWEKMIRAINSKKEAPTNYIRCYWNSLYSSEEDSFCRTKQLFQLVKKLVNNDVVQAKKFLKGLFDQYEVYLALRDLDDQDIFDDTQKKPLDCLRKFNLRTFYPLILALNSKTGLSQKKKASYYSVIESLMIRNMILGPESPNAYETKFASWASRISSGESVETVMGEVKEKMIPDSHFQTVYNLYTPESDTSAKIILWNIFNEDYKERPISKSPFKIHLEHIMPQDNSKWKVDNDFHDKYCNHLGNMTLLYYKLNEGASNNLLEDKHEQYKESDIRQTKDLLKVTTSDWTKELIEARQQYLFSVAMARWPSFTKEKKDLEIDLNDNAWKKIVDSQ